MITGLFSRNASEKIPASSRSLTGMGLTLAALALFGMTGCATVPTSAPAAAAPTESAHSSSETASVPAASSEEVLTLKAGDVLKITFAGVPTMDTQLPIRPDGRITLPMAGEVMAAGLTTDALTKQLREIYATKLVSNEVMVSLVSNAYTIYVTGAVLRPGKTQADRRITVFEAIMEAGGFDKARADLKDVTVIRQENGQSRSYKINVQKVLSGDSSEPPFYLKPFDTVYVKEKFAWF